MKFHFKRARHQRTPKTVAVVLAGGFRSMSFCMPKLVSYFSGEHDVRFFLSTWDSNRIARGAKNISNIFVPIENLPERITREYLLGSDYPLTSFWIGNQDLVSNRHRIIADEAYQSIPESQKRYAHEHATDPSNLVNTMNQFYLLKKGWELVQEYEIQKKKQFDVIVRARPDIIFKREIVWPLPGEIVSDSLRLSRTRKHGLFDGYFAGWRDDIVPVLEGYQAYLDQLAKEEFFREYISEVTIKWPFGYTSHKRVAGSKGRHSIVHTEYFYRYLLAQQSGITKLDSRVSALIVRPTA